MTRMQTAFLRYDQKTIVLHWLTAGLIVLLWGLAQIIDVFPRDSDMRVHVRSVHIVLGVALGFVLVTRILWRLRDGRTLPPSDTGLLNVLSHAAHYALYALMIAEVALGLATAWTRGDSIFNLFSIPPFDPANTALARETRSLHGLVANLILIVAGAHAAAALFHHYVRRDGVLQRMLPEM
ncbi:cytochrome b [Limobrevibacterium gyesilva]|uniref:Cytochrome b n=1 Tax=Limobrevibacterium gyesilva TaxID=2991712 RepID=A0AA41YT20_9PROT|nr:cytochrome b [Limobrevibacterium gyesilva]MCW3477823.1 cytochrome b [Limobrevibacterium gyesilva]